MLEILDPEGKTYDKYTVYPNFDGSFVTSVDVSEKAINGTYTARASYSYIVAASSVVIPEFPFTIIMAPLAIGVMIMIIRFGKFFR